MDDEYMKQMEIQRRNFEAQFGSLENLGFEDKSREKPKPDQQMSDDEDSEDDEDEKIIDMSDSEMSDSSQEDVSEESDDEMETIKPKVIKLNDNYSSGPIISKKEQKALRSGRAPTLGEIELKAQQTSKMSAKQLANAKKEDDDNLENDVKLQRLLQESHILSANMKYSGADITLQTIDYEEPTGKARKKALTSRIRSISSINSTGQPKKLEKMPMSMRKGMIKSREKRIGKYEEEAKNAGIILSKVKRGELRDLNLGKGSTFASDRLGSGTKQPKRIRDRGLKINAIGKSTKNGLMISKHEIERINKKRR